MKNASLHDAEYLDRASLDRELVRVFEKCHDCRRCLPLCPSFPSLFDAIDRHELEAAKMTPAETREVIDLCYQCKLCWNNCPYHPPHEWAIDFPKLMSRAKLVQAREEGIPLPERVGAQQDLMGKASCLTATLTNAAFKSRAARLLMEKATGIDRRWLMPSYEKRPFSKELERHQTVSGANGRAILFTTCFVEYSEARTARAALAVLEHAGVAVEGGYQACCGAPFLHGGDLESARKNAERVVAGLIGRVREGVPVVVPGPTCSYQLKHEFPELVRSDDARAVAAATLDLGEFVFKLAAAKTLPRDFQHKLGRIAYHLPCHLKAQNIGYRSLQLLGLVSDDVRLVDACSGVDGTWGMKARFWEQSQKVAERMVMEIRAAEPERVSTDCPLAALRIRERTGQEAVHPVVLLAEAYGLGGSR
ncbi:MAG TPA: heterodisulfide reductase-related iron-sulfur binding cluster [Myxococcota bacterium]|nr:heterodisulfide reductase-related iron-sulfur binding cluster [Myxococcota bacterium]